MQMPSSPVLSVRVLLILMPALSPVKGLDYLLELAEQMKRSFDEQNRLAEQIYLDVSSNQNRIRSSRQKMKTIQES